MVVARSGALACLFIILYFGLPSPLEAEPAPLDETGFSWAYGTIVDSVTVTGNKDTKPWVILREMETQPGEVLNAATFRRDIHFLRDMTPFSSVEARADSLAPGHCALRIEVRERSGILIRAVLPQVKYDFENGFTYGIRWNDQSFRGRLEDVTVSYMRNDQNDDSFNLSWSTPWVGWKHISVGVGAAYFNRGDIPEEISVLERLGLTSYVGIPLTESRITFSQLLLSMTFDKSRTGGEEADGQTVQSDGNEVSVAPLVGYRFDSRDSSLRPTTGGTFSTSARVTFPFDDGRSTYYRLTGEARRFVGLGAKTVLGVFSHVDYQLGDFPDYSYIRLGGPETLRGHPLNRFKGYHRWYSSLEWRYQFIPQTVFTFPIIHEFDIGMGVVTFLDSGIVWTGSKDFTLDTFHGTSGIGLDVYSPIQDVVRFEYGFNLHGDQQFHVSSGIRF
jgi:outer membrane protein insertion porin family